MPLATILTVYRTRTVIYVRKLRKFSQPRPTDPAMCWTQSDPNPTHLDPIPTQPDTNPTHLDPQVNQPDQWVNQRMLISEHCQNNDKNLS